jgi:hypothetical protein
VDELPEGCCGRATAAGVLLALSALMGAGAALIRLRRWLTGRD